MGKHHRLIVRGNQSGGCRKIVFAYKDDKNIQGLRDKPERQLGSLRDVIDTIRRDGGTPSIDGIATELGSTSSAQHAPVLLPLQQTHGNRYVQRVVTGIQAKLKVGQQGDIYEQEADREADAVMRMPNLNVQRQVNETKEKLPIQVKTITPIWTLKVQRQKVEGEEEFLKKKPQTKELPGHVPEVTPGLESSIHGLKGCSQPLPESVRDYYEPRFGYDFGQVRVHQDETETAHALKGQIEDER